MSYFNDSQRVTHNLWSQCDSQTWWGQVSLAESHCCTHTQRSESVQTSIPAHTCTDGTRFWGVSGFFDCAWSQSKVFNEINCIVLRFNRPTPPLEDTRSYFVSLTIINKIISFCLFAFEPFEMLKNNPSGKFWTTTIWIWQIFPKTVFGTVLEKYTQ